MSRRKLKENESSSSSLVLSEYNGPICNGNKYLLNTSSNIPTTVEKVENPNNKAYFSFKNLFKSIFLPEGYPNSVSEDYVAYQIWDTVQAFCSSISGTLAARAMFETIGVGDDQATVYGAVLTWLIKDGTGMVGRIIFAWHKGSSLDANSKMWRLYADILNDLSFLVDLTTPFFPRVHSIYFVSCSSLLRSLVGVAGGATRSALTQHQALQNNLADVSAKDSSQETLVNLVALIFNLVLFVYLKDSKLLIWPLFFIFVCGHLLANYCAVKSIVMKTFNRNRFHILSGIYLKSGEIPGPKKVNNGEPVLWTVRRWFSKIDLAAHINSIQPDILTSTNLGKLNQHHYLIDFNLKSNSVSVLFEPNINLLDKIKCLLQIEIVEYAIQNNDDDAKFKKLNDAIQDDDPNRIESESFSIVNKYFDDFVSRCKSEGWSFSYAQFSLNEFRYSFEKNQ